MGYTHRVTADDVRVAGELGALLDKGFFAQDFHKFPPNAEKTSWLLTEALFRICDFLVAGAGFEPATFGL